MAEITGGCLCGRVRYSVASAPVAALSCHCRDCQYVSGGAEANVLVVAAAALSVEGAPRRYESRNDRGAAVWRSFCADCGTPLFAGNAAFADFVSVKAGSLDDPERFERRLHIWTASAPHWHLMEEGLPKLPGNPPTG